MTNQKSDRQAKLQREFGFTCDCEACTNNFLTPPSLAFKDAKILKFAKKADDEILTLPPGQAMKKFRDCCEILEKENRNFPSLELCLLQKCIAVFLIHQAKPTFVH
jgi:hypothetical protein